MRGDAQQREHKVVTATHPGHDVWHDERLGESARRERSPGHDLKGSHFQRTTGAGAPRTLDLLHIARSCLPF